MSAHTCVTTSTASPWRTWSLAPAAWPPSSHRSASERRVPRRDDVSPVFIRKNADARRVEIEVATIRRIKAEPTRREDAQDVPVGDEDNPLGVTICWRDPSEQTIHPSANVSGDLAIRTAITKRSQPGCSTWICAVVDPRMRRSSTRRGRRGSPAWPVRRVPPCRGRAGGDWNKQR